MSDKKRRPRRGKAGDLEGLKRHLWGAVLTASELLDEPDSGTRLKACHALSQAAASYRSIYETADLETRLATLEARIARGDNEH